MPEIAGSFRSFDAAVQFFRAKVNIPTQRWDDLWQAQHAPAFVVAGATKDALLSDLREAVDAAISQGETLEDFRKRFDVIVSRNGWTGWTGDGSAAGRAWRTRLIYTQNLQSAYMAGRWETLKTFPYLQYKHNSVTHPREEHLAWNGKIIARNDPWWQTHYPPNGWGCQCSVIGVSQARMKAEGWTADEPPPGGDSNVPPEFRYHIGVASQGDVLVNGALAVAGRERWTAVPGKSWAEYGRPDRVPADTPVAEPIAPIRNPAELRDAWRQLYGDVTTLRDPSGTEVLLSERVIEHWLEDPKRLDGREQYLPFLRETIEQPFEIWASFAQSDSGKVALRRYYVKSIQLSRATSLTMIAEVLPGGVWGTFDFFRGARPQPKNRQGMLIWGRPLK